MKVLCCAISASVALASLPTLQASARPVESDFFCYMRTPTGRVIDLTAAMCGVEQSTFSRNGSFTTSNTFPNAGDVPTAAANDLNYNPRYRSVRTETRGGVTRTISGGYGDNLSDDRDRTTVISPGINSTGNTCVYAGDRDSIGRLCGGRASSQRPGGR